VETDNPSSHKGKGGAGAVDIDEMQDIYDMDAGGAGAAEEEAMDMDEVM
jgi:hypothetical protein